MPGDEPDEPDERDEPAEPDEPVDADPPVSVLGDELDLHTFLPRECADVVEEYVRAAQEAGMTRVRIIHGKGTGTLRRIVHAVLAKHPAVARFQLADGASGSWGATIAELRPRDPAPD
ncbi:MAG TPA: Smr/MutS family protein [Kofleriaceae bacterium]|nr:Smr/MutS family protein [Kofleriaceae bacterium]